MFICMQKINLIPNFFLEIWHFFDPICPFWAKWNFPQNSVLMSSSILCSSAHYPWWLFFKNLFHQKKCKGAIKLFKLGDTLTSCKKSENFYKWFWKKAPDKGTSRQMDVGYWIWPRFNMINLVLILVLYKIVLCSFCHYEQLKYCWLADLNAVGILNCFVFSISGQKPDKTIYTWSIHWSFINQVSLKLVP